MSFLTDNTLINMKTNIKPIRSYGYFSNARKKNFDLILKVSLRPAQYHFFVSPHEIIKFSYCLLKIALNWFYISCALSIYVSKHQNHS